ncbi:DUF3422 family protein [Paramagnetospirillum magneticum]|uniref:Uncharacterized membrane-anchored protein conserved in bacteria n=1 Tax=Paramagnetospirillum magneticum (strain ATCC 700264 / AMB-1) TaxID=342108 RepID=Q2VZL6_PARM1|nr:DUF3422 domain-containing protein [Paramagnetospirillum magneticum]BAE52959.1 Uncharacterized membrane-anchored protein conserved in bacteria [Paramagnetospirillum magneticum AMB-1]
MAEGLPIRLNEHAQRRSLAGEVHARPYELLSAPVRASQLAMVGANPADEREHLTQLLASHGAEPPGDGAGYFIRDLGGFRLRWERHSEFSTYTVMRFDPFDDGFAHTALDMLPASWLETMPGEAMTAVHVLVTKELPDDLGPLFDGNTLVGAKVLWGAGEAWTDFRLHADGFSRVVLKDCGLTRGQTGRLVQRLLEIETYRMMALLAFPLARQSAPEVARIDRELAGIVSQLADPAVQQNDRDLLEHLTRLAAEAERLDAATSFRMSAAKAYYAIVCRRIEELREDRIPGLQTFAEFVDRRLGPAMKTCESVSERQQLLATRVSRAGDLLRTRVDIALEEKNRDLLNSMNRRAELQLRLQETVEGLSVVAISYYLLGLIGYLAKGLKSVGLPVDYDLAGLIGLPVVAAAVWLGVRRLRKALSHKGE